MIRRFFDWLVLASAGVFFVVAALVAISLLIASPASGDILNERLLRALQGGPVPPTPIQYFDADDRECGERKSPSSNWPTLMAAAELVAPDTMTESQSVAWWLRYLREARGVYAERCPCKGCGPRWMGKEFASSIYRHWMYVPVMSVHAWAVANGVDGLQAESARWLRAVWAIHGLVGLDVPERGRWTYRGRWGRCSFALAGARSYSITPNNDPHHLDRHEGDIVACQAAGYPARAGWSTWSQRVVDALARKYGLRGPLLYGLTESEQQALRRHLKTGAELDTLVSWLDGYGVIGPTVQRGGGYVFRRYEGCVLGVMRYAGPSSTAPVAAKMVTDKGRPSALACNAGVRVQVTPQRASADDERDLVTCWLEDGTVHPNGLPRDSPGVMRLEGCGELVYSVVFDRYGARVESSGRDPGAGQPVPPGPTVDVERLWDIHGAIGRNIRREDWGRAANQCRALIAEAEGGGE